jgi:hypothetical protein
MYGEDGGLSSLPGGQLSDQEPKRPEGIEDQDWQKYIAARDEAAKYRKESGDMGRYVREGEGSYDQWKAMTANPAILANFQGVSRPDMPTLNPSMPGEPGFGRPNVMLPQPFLPGPDGVTPRPGGDISDHMVRPPVSDHMVRPPVALPYSGGVMPRPGGVTPRPSMPGFMPRPGGGLIPPPDIQPLLPPELLPGKPPEDYGRPRPTPINPLLAGLYQLPTGQQASNLTSSGGPTIRPPSLRLKHGGSLTNRVSDLLQILS